jgi:hypothetical protein
MAPKYISAIIRIDVDRILTGRADEIRDLLSAEFNGLRNALILEAEKVLDDYGSGKIVRRKR